MADPKPDQPKPATKKSRRRPQANRSAIDALMEQETGPSTPNRSASPAADPQQALVAYALGQLSLDQLAQARASAAQARQPQRAAAPFSAPSSMAAPAAGGAPTVGHEQIRGALHRLKVAKESGVLSRGELDRAQDTILAAAPEAAVPSKVEVKTPRQPQAESIVRTHVFYTSGAGLLSLGFLDPFLVPGLQLKMLQNLCQLYSVPFTEEWGKELIGTLLGTAVAKSLAIRAVPLIGVFAAPITNAAATWALGRVFIQHFESGGTLLKFSPEKLKMYFSDYFHAAPPLVTTG